MQKDSVRLSIEVECNSTHSTINVAGRINNLVLLITRHGNNPRHPDVMLAIEELVAALYNADANIVSFNSKKA